MAPFGGMSIAKSPHNICSRPIPGGVVFSLGWFVAIPFLCDAGPPAGSQNSLMALTNPPIC